MKAFLPAVSCALALLLLFAAAPHALARPRVVAYVPNWVDLNALAPTIDYAKLTHINIAFENPKNADGDLSFNERNRVLIDRARANGVKVLVSIGGGSASDDEELKPRYFALLKPDRRAAFVAKLAEYVERHGFDGIDVDIEGPSINEDYGAFVADLSAVLKPRAKLLTAALSRGYGGDKVPDAALAHLDFLNIMAYDGTGPWNRNRAGQHSSMDYATRNVKYWLDRGLPKSKAVLGVPFYGYGFGDAFRRHGYSYKELVAAYPGAENADQVGSTIWYNGIPTLRAKAQYVIDDSLGGIMIWSLDQDAAGEKSLLNALHETLSATASGKD